MPAFVARPVFDQLLGAWTFTRAVPGIASITGRAIILPLSGNLARYQETAEITLANGTMLHGTQRYLHRRLPPPINGFEILFPETVQLFERLEFHPSDAHTLCAAADHLCAADRYLSSYACDADDSWRVQHTVRGPKKNYILQTVYRRETATPAAAPEPDQSMRRAEPAAHRPAPPPE